MTACGSAQTFGKTGTNEMRHLGRRMNDELSGAMIPERENALAFERMHGLARAGDLEIDGDRRRRGDRLDAAVERRFQKEIVAPAVVQLHGVGLASALTGDDGRQFVIIDLDEFGQIFGSRAIFAHAHRDRLADEPNLFPGKHRIFRDLVTGNRRTRDNGQDALQIVEKEDRVIMSRGPRSGKRCAHARPGCAKTPPPAAPP